MGYWLEKGRDLIPALPGIYCVYECTLRPDNTVTILQLLYIGESENVKARISTHEKKEEWLKYVREGNVLGYNFTPSESYRERLEAAYIFHHQPPGNNEYKREFPFERTTILSRGKIKFLNPHFTVQSPW